MTTYIRLVRTTNKTREVLQIFNTETSLKLGSWHKKDTPLIDQLETLKPDPNPTDIDDWCSHCEVTWTKPLSEIMDTYPEYFL